VMNSIHESRLIWLKADWKYSCKPTEHIVWELVCNRRVLARLGDFLEHYERGASLREVRPTLDVVS